MDDFVQSNLYVARDEWSARLVTILTPLVIEGIRSIYKEAWNLCVTNSEQNKYLLCFQNMLCSIPKWSDTIIDDEKTRIVDKSGCSYLEDLLTCVHIIQMKLLTCIRVGNKQKKIDISIPKLSTFIHKVYIHCARKVYTNVYLFENGIDSLTVQKHNRELELIVQSCILLAIRESIPTEAIIRAYLDESIEHEEEIIIEPIEDIGNADGNGSVGSGAAATAASSSSLGGGNGGSEDGEKGSSYVLPEEDDLPETVPTIKNIDDEPVTNRLTFNDYDHVFEDGIEKKVNAPKTIERLEEISNMRNAQRKMDDDDDDDDDDMNETLKIHGDENVPIDDLDIIDMNNDMDDLRLDFEEL
jgi:hypothetical protein